MKIIQVIMVIGLLSSVIFSTDYAEKYAIPTELRSIGATSTIVEGDLQGGSATYVKGDVTIEVAIDTIDSLDTLQVMNALELMKEETRGFDTYHWRCEEQENKCSIQWLNDQTWFRLSVSGPKTQNELLDIGFKAAEDIQNKGQTANPTCCGSAFIIGLIGIGSLFIIKKS